MPLKPASSFIYARTSVFKKSKILSFIYARTSVLQNTVFFASNSKI